MKSRKARAAEIRRRKTPDNALIATKRRRIAPRSRRASAGKGRTGPTRPAPFISPRRFLYLKELCAA
ncbi:hypothetical protein CW354_13430 [Marinicaulis flavus]|uniref:Uncharacterized protein n=1 Tax=Hyphococcus luteus TaxID=2058213 RepID=A0A2S7K3I0_9PROT|nr:hypothetical protein CW354_13430 [Marinicaulis flavus]